MSNKFEFSLEKLLEIRKNKEEEGKKLFTASQSELQAEQNKLIQLQNNYDKYNGINNGETILYQKIKKNYLVAVSKGIVETEKNVEKKSKEVDYRREQLRKRQIERKTVDILREKKYSEFVSEENRKEQIINDEFALYAYMRNLRKEVK